MKGAECSDGRTERMRLGMLPSSATTCKRATASQFPTISLMSVGLYFSTCSQGQITSAPASAVA